MPGLPEGRAGDLMPDWGGVNMAHETQPILRFQYEEKLFPFWAEIVALAKASEVEQIALELHGNQVFYNVPSRLKRRAEVGTTLTQATGSGWVPTPCLPPNRLGLRWSTFMSKTPS